MIKIRYKIIQNKSYKLESQIRSSSHNEFCKFTQSELIELDQVIKRNDGTSRKE